MLSIERDTGIVRVHAPLNYDNVARLSVIVKAVDSNSAGPGQTATGELHTMILSCCAYIIHISIAECISNLVLMRWLGRYANLMIMICSLQEHAE